MKKIFSSIRYKFVFLCVCLLKGIYAVAQGDTLTSSDYHLEMPKHFNPIYNGPLRYIVFGVVMAVILYVTYRYWKDNSMGRDIWHDPR